MFALHPLYLSLKSLSKNLSGEVLERIRTARADLEPLEAVDYDGTLKAKLAIARLVFDEEGERALQVEYRVDWVQEVQRLGLVLVSARLKLRHRDGWLRGYLQCRAGHCQALWWRLG